MKNLTSNISDKFKYALGELILVIAGILIALQIDNWNEDRKTKEQEKIILTEIKSNLEQDLKRIERNINTLKNNLNSIQILSNALNSNQVYHDSLSKHFGMVIRYGHFPQNTSGYEMLKSKGLETIANVELRKKITILYERYYSYLHTLENERYRFNYSILMEEYLTKFKDNKIYYSATPIQFEQLKKDNRFRELLLVTKGINNYVYEHDYSETKVLVENLIKEIDTEIKQ